MKIIQYKSVDKGATRGYITLFVSKWQLTIYNITLYEKDGKMWISFPSKSYEADGKTKYFSFLRFETPEMMTKFQDAVINAWKEQQGTQAKLTSTPPTANKIAPKTTLQNNPILRESREAYINDERDGLPF